MRRSGRLDSVPTSRRVTPASSRAAYLHHVRIALGSEAELETQIELAVRLGFLTRGSRRQSSGRVACSRRDDQSLHGLSRRSNDCRQYRVDAHDWQLHPTIAAIGDRDIAEPRLREPESPRRYTEASPHGLPRQTEPRTTRSRAPSRWAAAHPRGRGLGQDARHHVSDRLPHRRRPRASRARCSRSRSRTRPRRRCASASRR